MTSRHFSLALALCVPPASLPAQASSPVSAAADSALAACRTASETPQSDREGPARWAETLWRAEIARRPADVAPHVGLARVLVQCRLPLVSGPAEQLGLFQAAVVELELAIQRDPEYWPARFTLGLVFARAPTFLGHTNDAIVQLEHATSERGIPPGLAELAEALHELARLYDQVGRVPDAAAARSRARRLFPDDQRFDPVQP